MQKTYVHDLERRAWLVALILADDGDTRDLKVYTAPTKTEVRAGVRRFDPRGGGGWSDAPRRVDSQCELAALEEIAALEAEENAEEDAEPAEPVNRGRHSQAGAGLVPTVPPAEAASFDPGELTVEELEEHLEDVDDLEDLARIRLAEEEGKGRKTALDAIDDRAAALASNGDGDHGESEMLGGIIGLGMVAGALALGPRAHYWKAMNALMQAESLIHVAGLNVANRDCLGAFYNLSGARMYYGKASAHFMGCERRTGDLGPRLAEARNNIRALSVEYEKTCIR